MEHQQKALKISDHGRQVATNEVKSLLDHGYRSYGELRLPKYEAYFFRHQTNGHKARVILRPQVVQVFIDQRPVQLIDLR